MRGSIAGGLKSAAQNVKSTLKVYSLAKQANPPAMEFVSGSGKTFNTIHTNDYSFYEHLNEVIQYEPLGMLDPETRGLLASIGIEKGEPFAPDERLKKILTDAVAIANAAARSIVWYPRLDGIMNGIQVYSDSDSAWIMGWVDKNVFSNGKGRTDYELRRSGHVPLCVHGRDDVRHANSIPTPNQSTVPQRREPDGRDQGE